MSSRRVFRAVIDGYAPAANPTDIVTLFGGTGGQIIELISWTIHYSADSGATKINASLIKRSSVNTGGTSTVITPVALDGRGQGKHEAVLRKYTANPTNLGTAVGGIGYFRVLEGQAVIFALSDILHSGPQCRNANEGLCLNLGGVTVPGTNPLITNVIEWREFYV